MKKYNLVAVCCFLILTAFTVKNNSNEPTPTYKCMVQLKNYEGEGAYVVVTVVDKNDKYLKTLHVLGDDEKWLPDLPKWWAFFEKSKENIDAITGATIAGGERSIFTFEIDQKYMVAGNKLRFETAVEHQDYYEKDLEVSLDNKNLKNKFEGTGYIRYVRIIPN